MKIITLFVCCCSIVSCLTPLFARADGGITISPAFQEVVIRKEQSESSFEITVKNTSDTMLTIRLGALDVGQLNDSGGVAFIGRDVVQLERSYGLVSWLQFDRDVMIIGPKEQQSLQAKIINQESLSPGGHYAAVVGYIEDPQEDKKTDTDVVDVKSAFSTLVFVKKEGGERYQLDLQRIVHAGTWFKLPKMSSLYLHNGGNVHVVPRGIITIADPLGRTVSKGIINESSLLVLPETFRTMPVAIRTLVLPYLPGIYRLRVDYRYDGREQMSRIEEPILYIGWVGIGIVIIVCYFILFWIKRVRKRFRKA